LLLAFFDRYGLGSENSVFGCSCSLDFLFLRRYAQGFFAELFLSISSYLSNVLFTLFRSPLELVTCQLFLYVQLSIIFDEQTKQYNEIYKNLKYIVINYAIFIIFERIRSNQWCCRFSSSV
jgi:hypothetical protein